MNYLLLFLSSLGVAIYQFLFKKGSSYCKSNVHALLFSGFLFLFCACFSLGIYFLEGVTFCWADFIYSIVTGISLAVAQYAHVIAFENGSVAITSLITGMNSIIPFLFFILIGTESFSVFKIVALFFFILCLFFSTQIGVKDKKQGYSLKWWIFTALCFFGNGFLSVFKKLYAESSVSPTYSGFLALSYLVGAVLTFLFLLPEFMKGKKAESLKNTFATFKWKKMTFVTGAVAVVSVFCNYLSTYLSPRIDASIHFPVYSGLSLILVILISCVFFHERMTRRTWISIFTGIISVVFFNLSF